MADPRVQENLTFYLAFKNLANEGENTAETTDWHITRKEFIGLRMPMK